MVRIRQNQTTQKEEFDQRTSTQEQAEQIEQTLEEQNFTQYTSRDSNIIGYKVGTGEMQVMFKGGATYLYTVESTGSLQFGRMLMLAQANNGLGSYINRVVKKNYARRIA